MTIAAATINIVIIVVNIIMSLYLIEEVMPAVTEVQTAMLGKVAG